MKFYNFILIQVVNSRIFQNAGVIINEEKGKFLKAVMGYKNYVISIEYS